MSAESGPAFPAVVGVGASAGGVEALIAFARELPLDLRAPVLIVLHLAPSGTSVLSGILDRNCPLPVTTASSGEALAAGHLYVAPPDQHLRVHGGVLHLDREPRINGHRPAIDPLFESLAHSWGSHAIGVILSGTRDDGTLGLARIKANGGRCYVQDPDEALYSSMPANALRAVAVDGTHPAAELADVVARLADVGLVGEDAGVGRTMSISERIPTRLSCPDCGGVLFEDRSDGIERFACSVGHVYGPESLDVEQARQLESALWAAVRSLEDRADLLRRMAARSEARENARQSEHHRAEADEALRRAEMIRSIVAQSRDVA